MNIKEFLKEINVDDDTVLPESSKRFPIPVKEEHKQPVETIFDELDKIVKWEKEAKFVLSIGKAYKEAMNALKMVPEYLDAEDTYGSMLALWTANQKFRTFAVGVLEIQEYDSTPADFIKNVDQMEKEFVGFRALVLAALSFHIQCTGEGYI